MRLIDVAIRFDRPLQAWDGFGFNYVETAQTQDNANDPQDYGGFSILSEQDRLAILELVFGADGLKPGLLKMFYDPWHQPTPDQPEDDRLMVDQNRYDHQTSTAWVRYFARHGLQMTRAQGRDLQVITTLYGPPGWMTRQRALRGRDLDPAYRLSCARYLVSWAKYLKEVEGLPVGYISVHNEGEDWWRWREDGSSDWGGHDYNLYWPPEQVVDFLRLGKQLLDANGMADVSFTPGECTNWLRFFEWGYADAIADDPQALANMGLITSHGFTHLNRDRWFADWRSAGIDLLRAKRPELHAWVTSTSWAKMDVFMLNEMRSNIYVAKVNGVIPWAGIQRSSLWKEGDPNPGTAIRVHEDGRFVIEPGYYFYKHYCRAGQPGMAVARVSSNDTEVVPLAFCANGSANSNAFVLLNLSTDSKQVRVGLAGSNQAELRVFRTSPLETYRELERITPVGGEFTIDLPALSVSSFFAE